MPISSDPRPDLTFADVARAYLDRHIRRHLVPRAAQLAQYADAFLATVEVPAPTGGTIAFPDKPFRVITTDDVEHAIEQKAQAGTKTMQRPGRAAWTRRVGGGPTANRLHAHLRSLWRWAIAKGYAETTPFARAGLPTLRMRPEHARERRLVGEEGARLLAACGPHLRDVVIAALETGCRKQELLSLQWGQVHWARNELYLPATKTKTKWPRRIPISAALYTVLMARRTRATGAAYAPHDYVFGTSDGARIRDIKTAWTASCRRAGIEGLRLHDLRHEAGSRKLEAGYPMHAVSLWLGHTTLTTTARYLNADIGQLHALNDRPVPAAVAMSMDGWDGPCITKSLLDDELWKRIEPLLPKRRSRRRRYASRTPIPDRAVLTGILFVLRSGIPWNMLPQEMGCGSGTTCWRRLVRWPGSGYIWSC